ncbi:hypothetical protein EYF80_031039 [Liparis tanakae]|uniref:Uncharacterized protein n=1 Tax=Liparis tanakae TaxID=230148 RepID=A0A4Z2H1K9_9TELE|nr:hypothetical protein EYF80_031039 [Liparis tanakae]
MWDRPASQVILNEGSRRPQRCGSDSSVLGAAIHDSLLSSQRARNTLHLGHDRVEGRLRSSPPFKAIGQINACERRRAIRPPPCNLRTFPDLTGFHSRTCFFRNPTRDIGAASTAGGRRCRWRRVEAADVEEHGSADRIPTGPSVLSAQNPEPTGENPPPGSF